MSQDVPAALIKALQALPKGFHPHNLGRFVNGKVCTTRRGTVKLPIEIGIEQLGSPYDDLKAVLNPQDNKIVPILVFLDVEEASKHLDAREAQGAAQPDLAASSPEDDAEPPYPVYRDECYFNVSEDGMRAIEASRSNPPIPSPDTEELPDPATAAIEFALETDEGLAFLRCWNEGRFDVCRREWPEAPDACYIGADQFFKPAGATA